MPQSYDSRVHGVLTVNREKGTANFEPNRGYQLRDRDGTIRRVNNIPLNPDNLLRDYPAIAERINGDKSQLRVAFPTKLVMSLATEMLDRERLYAEKKERESHEITINTLDEEIGKILKQQGKL